jgi:hypothetical protein
MIDRSKLLRTAKAMLILAAVAVCITAITVSASRWSGWHSNEPRIVIQPR